LFTSPPRIVQEADSNEIPPEIETLENRKIAAFTQAGDVDQHIEMPPPGSDKGITKLPRREVEDPHYIPVHIESSYPGGRVIRMSGRWTPANNNGRKVRTYKQQAIVFQLNNE
jgi:hypothetical protein